jgi:hypothetical protein
LDDGLDWVSVWVNSWDAAKQPPQKERRQASQSIRLLNDAMMGVGVGGRSIREQLIDCHPPPTSPID